MLKKTVNLRKLSLEKKKNISNKTEIYSKCNNCDNDEFTPYDGHIICKCCGLYLYKEIDNSKEWRQFDNSNKTSNPERCSVPNCSLLPESSQGTMVGYINNESISMKRIVTMNKWKNNPYKEQSMNDSFKYITNICRNGNIPQNIIEETKNIYFKLSQIIHSRRSKRQALIVTSVIIAYKINNINCNYNELADLFNLDIKVLRRQVKLYEETWKHIIEKEEEEKNKYVNESIENYTKVKAKNIKNNNKPMINDNTTIIDEDTKTKKKFKKNKSNKKNANNKKKSNENVNNFKDNDKSDANKKLENETENKKLENETENKKLENDTYNNNINSHDEINQNLNDKENNNGIQINLNKYNSENVILKKLSNLLNIDKNYFSKIILLNFWINHNNLLNEHIPISKYACIFYIISKVFKLNLTKKNISNVCNVSNVTILKCYSKIEDYESHIIDLLNSTL